ncbi:MAG TPA: hypothetical protein VFJ71_09905 [Candidatus Limnocylindrales bacterium]|nr:hypothetical protein [Candidatus Limnocylindrales bacterium]
MIPSSTACRSDSPERSRTAAACAACESMQKKQSFEADTAVAIASRSNRLIVAPG